MPESEAKIRALIEKRVHAVREKNVAHVSEDLGTELVTYDVVDPLRRIGAQGSQQRAEEWFGLFDGPIGVELGDITVFADGNTGFAHYLVRYSGLQHGTTIDMWVRVTLGFAAVEGQWRLVHEHSSVPFDPHSGKASLELKR